MLLLLLLLGAAWISILLVVVGACVAARNGDHRHERPTSRVVRAERMDPNSSPRELAPHTRQAKYQLSTPA
jgi:hypothetical protein